MRLVSRYRRMLTHMHNAEVNRLHKMLDDAGIKLGGVVSDINGVSATAMARKSHKKAIVAVAHKMIRLIYVLLARKQGRVLKVAPLVCTPSCL